MSESSRLKLSIMISVLVYLAIQCVIWVFTISPALAAEGIYLWFFVVAAVLHLFMTGFLVWRNGDFRHTKTREMFRRVNLATHLTLFRLSCVPTILFLAIGVANGDASGLVLVILVAVAFISDFFDGQVARRMNQTTDLGAYLDSSTDYAVLIVLSVAFLVLTITPLWYFLILMGRLMGFALAMAVLTKVQGEVSAETTFLGKAAVFSAMAVYALELARYIGLRGVGNETVVLIVEIISAAILVVSVADKYIYLVRKFRATADTSE